MAGETTLGDYTIVFNFGTFCELEDRTGRKTQDLIEAMTQGLSFSELRDFVWAGLQTHYRGMNDEAVLDLLNEQGYEAAGQAVGKAISAFFGGRKEKVAHPQKAAA